MKILSMCGLAASLLAVGLAYLFTNSTQFGLCLHDQYSCRELLNNVGDPLFWSSLALASVFFVLVFIPHALSIWWKFAIWYIPLAVIILVTWPQPTGSWFIPSDLGFGVEQGSQLLGFIYVLVSLVLIFWKSRQVSGK